MAQLHKGREGGGDVDSYLGVQHQGRGAVGVAPFQMSRPDPERSWVHLIEVPVALFLELHVWLADVYRELQLVEVGAGEGLLIPPRLRELAVALHVDVARPRDFAAEQLESASEHGYELTDVWLDLLPEAVQVMARLVVLCDEVAECSRSGLMLTGPPTPSMEHALRWMAREFIGQLEIGRPPRPYAAVVPAAVWHLVSS